METNGQRLYTVLTRKEVGEKMMKEIDQISEVFSLSKSDATVILIHLRWNSFKASDRLGDDKERFLAGLGLVKVSEMSQENESVSCFADHKIHSDGDGDYLVSTPFCSHKFCITCWSEFLEKIKNNINEEEGAVAVLCPNPDCAAPVGPDTIEKFTGPLKEMYESYVLGSFMECNKESIKWCPAPGCDFAIERHEDVLEDGESCLDFGVVCLCGHTFCWSCQLESHRPVTCNKASLWCNRVLDELKSVAWVAKNTKCCPRCNSPLQRNGDPDLRLITCICSCSFCWRCFRSEEEHNKRWKCVEVAVPPSKNHEKADPSHTFTQTHYLNMWESSHEDLEKSKSDLKTMEENDISRLTDDFGLTDGDIRALREALVLIIQCRLALKWSCVFDYFITDYHSTKKPYVDYQRKEATRNLLKHKGTIEEVMNLAISGGDITFLKHKLETTTTETGIYFHKFVKNFEDGLPEVKVDSYENASVRYWLCDRCMFKNRWSNKQCKMCFVPLSSSSSSS